jgi:hypothetical protein
MFSLPSTVRVGLEPEIGNQKVQIRDGTFSMLEALDGFDPPLQLAIERLGHVVGPGQSMHTVMTHEPDPMAFEKADRFPLARRFAGVVSCNIAHERVAVRAMADTGLCSEALGTRQTEKTLDGEETFLDNIHLTNQTVAIGLDPITTAVGAMTVSLFDSQKPLSLLAKLKISTCQTDKNFQIKQQP